MEAMFSSLNLKPEDGFFPHSMSEVFIKTLYGLT